MEASRKGAGKAKDATIRTREEIKSLKAGAPDVWWRSAIGLWFTGLRMDEALSLQWSAVDFKAGTVAIRQSKAGSFKIGNESFPVLAWSAKTQRSYRTVPVAADTMAALQELQLQAGGSPYCFLSLARLRTIREQQEAGKWHANSQLVNNCLRDWKAMQARVLGEKVTPCTVHDCRKAFCTHAADLIPIHTLAEIAGDSVAVLTKHYTQAKAQHSDTLRKAFDDGPALRIAS
jgi:integrase